MFELYDEDWFGNQILRPVTKDVGNIRIRPATLEDLPHVADILAVAMLNEEVSAFLYPERQRYFSHYRDSLLRRLKQQNVTPGWVLCVAVQRENFRSTEDGLDKSLDKQRLADYNSGSMACFPFEKYRDLWYLENVAVHPAYQHRGIGRLLVQWGMEHADIECVPVGLEARATVKGMKLWDELGFIPVNETETTCGNVRLRAMLWDAIYLID